MPYSWVLALGTTPRVHNAVVAFRDLQRLKQLTRTAEDVLSVHLAGLSEAERGQFGDWVGRGADDPAL